MKRYIELDSLRGIAALCVIFSHFVFIMQDTPRWIQMANLTPIRLFMGGHAAVIFFFVLSGFVLSLSLLNSNKMNYSRYLITRISRIYIPYIAVLLLALLLYYTTYSATAPTNHWWSAPITLKEIFLQFLLIPEFNDSGINPVVWSLTQEMRISIIFPLILIAAVKFKWYVNIAMSMGLTALSIAFNYIFPSTYSIPVSTNYFYTLHYIGMFMVGALLAVNKDKIINKVASLPKVYRFLFFLTGLLFYSYGGGMDKVLEKIFPAKLPWTDLVADWGNTIGVAIILISALALTKLSNVLKAKPLTFLGEISYSLYLVHAVILLSFIHLFHGTIPLWQLLLMVLMVTIPVSYISYLLIEKPARRLGKMVFNKKGSTKLESSISPSTEVKLNTKY